MYAETIIVVTILSAIALIKLQRMKHDAMIKDHFHKLEQEKRAEQLDVENYMKKKGYDKLEGEQRANIKHIVSMHRMSYGNLNTLDDMDNDKN